MAYTPGLASLSAFAQTILDDADAAATRSTLAAVGKGELIINVKDYGAVGDGVVDDTVALNAALADAATKSGIVYLPPEKTFLYNGTLTVPVGAILQGPGRGVSGNVGILKAGHANAVITFDSVCQIRDLIIDGNNVGNIGLKSVTGINHPVLSNLYISKFRQAGLVLDGTQNFACYDVITKNCASATTPAGWPAVGATMLINGASNGNFYNCCDAGEINTNPDYRSILVCDILTDARFNDEVVSGGNRECHWYGGIFESSDNGVTVPSDSRIEIRDGYSTRDFVFNGVEVSGANNDALIKMGPNFAGNLVLNDCTLIAGDSTATKTVEASSGTVHYRGSTRVSGLNGLVEGTVLSGTGAMALDERTRRLIEVPTGGFKGGVRNWTNTGTGVATHDATKRRMVITSSGVNSGARTALSGPAGIPSNGSAPYSAQYRVIKISTWVNIVSGTWRFHWTHRTTGTGTDIGPLVNGWNEFYLEMDDSNMSAVRFTQTVAGTNVVIEVGSFNVEHVS